MEIFHNRQQLQTKLKKIKGKRDSIGFVPTMGALHQGHLSLVKRAKYENELVVVSIFVNPTQFDNKDDLKKYPNRLENDYNLIKNISKNIIIFAPNATEIYSGNIISKTYRFNGLEKAMEGQFREGHFNGVATIVELLFNAVVPDKAYFGEKDFQQLQIIKKLVEIKKMSITIIGCPIEREPSGLALSSRNERLPENIRDKAGIIFETLKAVKVKFATKSTSKLKDWVKKVFANSKEFELQYFEITDVDTLTPIVKKQKNIKYRAFIAVYALGVRLIDNISLN